MEEGQVIEQNLKKAVSLAFTSGYQLDQEAFSLLKELSNKYKIDELMENIISCIMNLPDKPLFLTKDIIENNIQKILQVEDKSVEFVESVRKVFKPLSKEFPSELEILSDPTESICSEGNVTNFLKYFQDRFLRIRNLLRERTDVKNTVSIKEALKSSSNTKVKIIGMITNIRMRQEIMFMQIEDFEAVATVLVTSRSNGILRKKAENILLDQVVCVDGVRSTRDYIVATELIYPDIPDRKPNTANKAVYAALLSDLHIGSKQFQRKSFNKFLRWLKGQEGNYRHRSIASRVKYVVIAGDVVDGVGIYPGQLEELAIKDIYEQYASAAELIQQIPEYIEVIIIPGNHDATRQALPQPAISKEYGEPLYETRKIVMIGDPAKIRMSGVEFLLYHGRSLDDVIANVPDITYQNLHETISKAMRCLLKIRHLAPIYGSRTPIAPEILDYLVIDSVPDVFHSGHVHIFGYESYRGTLIVNSGSWQSQTPFQEKMGLYPTWGVAPILNLKTLKVTPIEFS
jgi:DNA polymerase II small subunit